MNTESLAYHILTVLLRVALLALLVAVGWSIYSDLPVGPTSFDPGGAAGAASARETSARIVLRAPADETGAPVDIPVEMYQTDIASVWREYSSEPRPGVRFEDFLAKHLKGRPTVMTRLDQRGQATVTLAPGRWLVRALLAGQENVEWRLPVNISGPGQTIELTPENSYARTKSF